MPDITHTDFPFPGFGDPAWAVGVQVRLRITQFGQSGDDHPPEVELVSPPQGTMPSASTPIVVRISDAVFLRRVVLIFKFPALDLPDVVDEEVVFNGSTINGVVSGGFSKRYASGSSVVFQADEGTMEFSFLRRGGWPTTAPNINLEVVAVDFDGNEA